MEQITLTNITKKYNNTTILNNISQSFRPGQSIAFVGHNGCGKSTLLRIIAGLTAPTSGKVSYGRPLLFHYVPEKFMPVSLTGRTYLIRMGELDGLKTEVINEKIEQLGSDFFLSELLDVSMKSLSKGTLQKIGVIQALMKTPDVLMLDEPLSGQDEASQKVFIHKINKLRTEGVTVFMSCHEQSLVNAISEKTYTILNGELVSYQPENEREYALILENTGNQDIPQGMVKFGNGYKLTVPEGRTRAAILDLLQKGWDLRGMYDEKNN